MGLFDLSDILPLSKLLFGETPSVYDVIDFVDTVTMESNLTDEKRSFYEKATEKYKVAYTSIKAEYQLIKDFIENHKDSSEQSISILKGLTEEKNESFLIK